MIKLGEKSFGQFISEKRKRRSINVQELAEKLHISTAYMSQIESGVRTNPGKEILEKLSNILMLDNAEKYTLFDLYAKANDTISPDLADYIKCNSIVSVAIRSAIEHNAGKEVWQMFIDRLKNEQ